MAMSDRGSNPNAATTYTALRDSEQYPLDDLSRRSVSPETTASARLGNTEDVEASSAVKPSDNYHEEEEKLKRTLTPCLLVAIYTILALFSWIITCILVERPITTSHYGVFIDDALDTPTTASTRVGTAAPFKPTSGGIRWRAWPSPSWPS
jgi:hypothetical protein